MRGIIERRGVADQPAALGVGLAGPAFVGGPELGRHRGQVLPVGVLQLQRVGRGHVPPSEPTARCTGRDPGPGQNSLLCGPGRQRELRLAAGGPQGPARPVGKTVLFGLPGLGGRPARHQLAQLGQLEILRACKQLGSGPPA